MHLALFVKSMSGGGAERVMLNLSRTFAERDFRVDLVLANTRGPLLPAVPAAVRVVDLGVGHSLLALPALLRRPGDFARVAHPTMLFDLPHMFGSIPRLAGYLRRERPEALLSAPTLGNIAALWARRLAAAPTRILVSEHNPLSIRVARRRVRRTTQLPRLVRHFYPRADAIAACSKGVADDLATTTGLPRDAIEVVYNPAVNHGGVAREAAEPVDHPWFAPGEAPVILGAGRLSPQKDFATLLRAFALLRRKRAARLMVLGVGSETERLVGLAAKLGIREDFALPGFVPKRLAYFSRAGVFVLSSAWEGLPTVLIEAMACGCPVVSTDCVAGPAEILEDGVHGDLVPVGDAHALADAMAAALDRPPRRDALRARARFFDDTNAFRRYAELLGVSA